ncbi:MAG: hypothetical protein H7Y88_13340 [Phycisphaerales bacterium]|nr:hypothetical protein [Phycisphaerales bacterium]
MSRRSILALLAAAAWMPPTARGDDTREFPDAPGDAVLRRTDAGNDGPVPPDFVADLLLARLSCWQMTTPGGDRFSGSTVNGDDAHLVRIDLVFAGVSHPSGPLGLGGGAFDPMLFGPHPVVGFLELNIDRERDTGGELAGATNRYLANIARFGTVGSSSIAPRVALSAAAYDGDFFTDPQYERSGVEFAVVLCGCETPVVVTQGGDADGQFEAGETWIVQGRFFQRAGGYIGASAMNGGSVPGAYDPTVPMRVAHDPGTNRTTFSIVFALDPAGAAVITGGTQQPPDDSLFNHVSIQEALMDLVDGANGLNGGPLFGEELVLTSEWADVDGDDLADMLDPTDWRASALFGVPYISEDDSLYAWTDVGFENLRGDLDGDDIAGALDQQAIEAYIESEDGGFNDQDGLVNGSVEVQDFGLNFSVYDLTGDGLIGESDVAFYGGPNPCPTDFDGSGVVNSADLTAYLAAWFHDLMTGTVMADFNSSGVTNSADITAFLAAWFGSLGPC